MAQRCSPSSRFLKCPNSSETLVMVIMMGLGSSPVPGLVYYLPVLAVRRMEVMKIQVECYAGHKAAERPIKFWLGDIVLFVESIEDQWYGSDAYFRVRADDGNTYVLSHNEMNNQWTLASFRSQASPAS